MIPEPINNTLENGSGDSPSDLEYEVQQQEQFANNTLDLNSELRDVTTSFPEVENDAAPPMNFHNRDRSNTSKMLESISRTVRSTTITGIQAAEVQCPDRNNNAFVAGWNVINLIQGIGILGIPYAYAKGSWSAIAVTICVSAMCCYTGQMLVDCLYTVCPVTGKRTRVHKSYSCVGAQVWPRFGRQLVSLVCVTEMFGGMVLYIILLATMPTTLFKSFELPWDHKWDMYYWSTIMTYCTLPLLFVSKISIISWFSMIAVINLMASTVTILVYCFLRVNDMEISRMPEFDISKFPVSLGIIVFSYCAHAVFPGIEESMRKPSQYPAMMNTSFTIAAIMKCIIGVLPVLLFGEKTGQEVTSNMTEAGFGTAISIMVLLNVFFSVPLVMFVVTERFDAALRNHFHPWLQATGRLHFGWIFVTRAALLTSALLVAMAVPHFALLMGIVGSVTGTCLCFLFPCLFSLKIQRKELSKFGIAIRCFIIIFGLLAGGFGVVFSGLELKKSFQ